MYLRTLETYVAALLIMALLEQYLFPSKSQTKKERSNFMQFTMTSWLYSLICFISMKQTSIVTACLLVFTSCLCMLFYRLTIYNTCIRSPLTVFLFQPFIALSMLCLLFYFNSKVF